MKKQFKIHKDQDHPDFFSIDLMEDDKIVGGYLIPDWEENRKNMAEYLEKKGYTEYEKADRIN